MESMNSKRNRGVYNDMCERRILDLVLTWFLVALTVFCQYTVLKSMIEVWGLTNLFYLSAGVCCSTSMSMVLRMHDFRVINSGITFSKQKLLIAYAIYLIAFILVSIGTTEISAVVLVCTASYIVLCSRLYRYTSDLFGNTSLTGSSRAYLYALKNPFRPLGGYSKSLNNNDFDDWSIINDKIKDSEDNKESDI